MKIRIKDIINVLTIFILLGSNIISATSVSFAQSSISIDAEEQYHSCGAYPLGEDVVPSIAPQNTYSTPSHFDWRNVDYQGENGNWLTSVKKQGKCGSCWAFAAIGAIEAMVNIQKKNPSIDLDLSEQHLVSCCTLYSNGCHGGNSYYAWDYLMDNNGAILESAFPYEGIDANGCDNWKSDDCNKDPITCDMKADDWDDFTVPIKSKGYYDADLSLIQDTLVNYGPVATYMLVYSDFNYYTGGIYEKNENAELEGGHAVIIIGYDKEEDYLICKNSWGEIWGEDGYFRIPYGECLIGEQIYFVEIDEDLLNFPPNARASGLQSADIAEPISFSSQQSSDLDNNIVSYQWDFGDGTTSSDPNPIHSYNQKGIYPVTLTVTDSHGKQDVDETAVFIELWDVDDSWTYKFSFETIPDALYPPIRFPLKGEIPELTLTVAEEQDETYILDIKGSFKGNFSLNFDLQNTIFDFRLWSKIRNGKIDGSLQLNKKGFSLEEYEVRLKGFANIVSLPIIPLPLWIPTPFELILKKTIDDTRPLLSIAPNVGKSMHIPSANSSSEIMVSLFFGLLSNTFQNSQIMEEITYTCTNFEEISTIAGNFNSYKYIIDSTNSFKESELYYSPTIHNIVRLSGADTELYSYHGELISTNVE